MQADKRRLRGGAFV